MERACRSSSTARRTGNSLQSRRLNAAKPYGIDVEEIRLRAGRDGISRRRDNYDPDPAFVTYGPKTRREFLNLLRWAGDRPT